jgi:hypothetical protein
MKLFAEKTYKPIFVGYFPKQKSIKETTNKAWLQEISKFEISSVSNCIIKGPENWINIWKHNEFGFYDDIKTILSNFNTVQYNVYAYEIFPFGIDDNIIFETKLVENAKRIKIGVKGYFMEGSRKVGVMEVVKILDLLDNCFV